MNSNTSVSFLETIVDEKPKNEGPGQPPTENNQTQDDTTEKLISVLLDSQNKNRVMRKQVTNENTWVDNLNENRKTKHFETMTEHEWLEFVFQNMPYPLEEEDKKKGQTKEGKERVKKMRQLASGMLFEDNDEYLNSDGAHLSDPAL